MLSFQDQYTMFQNLTQDTSSAALTFGKQQINVGQRILETEMGGFTIEETKPITTTASNNTYDTPARHIRLKQAYVTVDSVRYVMDEVVDEDEWQQYQGQLSTSISDIAQKIFVRDETFEIWPTPTSDAGNVITFRHEAQTPLLQFDDYTDGNISDLTNGDETVTGSSTTFTEAMEGRYFKIDADGVWYKIDDFTSTTALELAKAYEGLTISGGSSSYTIGQMPLTPPDTHQIPVYYAAMQYFQGFKQSKTKAAHFKAMYDGDIQRVKGTYSRRYSSRYIPPTSGRGHKPIINPNHYPTLSSS